MRNFGDHADWRHQSYQMVSGLVFTLKFRISKFLNFSSDQIPDYELFNFFFFELTFAFINFIKFLWERHFNFHYSQGVLRCTVARAQNRAGAQAFVHNRFLHNRVGAKSFLHNRFVHNRVGPELVECPIHTMLGYFRAQSLRARSVMLSQHRAKSCRAWSIPSRIRTEIK